MKLLWCVLFGHKVVRKGHLSYVPGEPSEYDEWFECSRCGDYLSTVFDESTLIGRIKAWWYQE